MAFEIYHSFVSAKADSGDATLLQPSNWNAPLVVAGADVGGIPYCPTAATIATSSKFAFDGTTLNLAMGTVTAAPGAISITQTRNTVGTTYDAVIKAVITDTASASGSLVMQILGGASGATQLFAVDKSGSIYTAINGSQAFWVNVSGQNPVGFGRNSSVPGFAMWGGSQASPSSTNADAMVTALGVITESGNVYSWASSNVTQSADTGLSRISAGVVGVGTGAQGSSAGTIQGKHNSSDGTAGVASFGPAAVASITVKDGIITAIS